MVAYNPNILPDDAHRRLSPGEEGTSYDWLVDEELTEVDQTRCADIATARTGHDERRCWPADELHGVLEDRA